MRPPRPRADHVETLTEALRQAAFSDHGITLVGEDDREQRRTYAELYRGALERAAALRAMGLGSEERVIIVLNTSFEFVEVFFGVMLAGGVPVPAYPPLAMSRMDSYCALLTHVADVTEARFLVTDRVIGATLGTLYGSCATLREVVSVDRLSGDPAAWPPVEPAAATPGLIQCTSGSTSSPKAVVLTHGNLLANVRGMARAFSLNGKDAGVSWVPLYHDMGLIGGLLTFVCEALPLVLLPPNLFIRDTSSWWRAVSRHRATITAGPNFAYGLSARRMDSDELASLDLSSVRVALCGAEPIQPAVVRTFLRTMARAGFAPGAFFPAYGLAESCVGVTMPRPGEGLRVDRVCRESLGDAERPRAVPASGPGSLECASVGRPIPGTRVAVRGPGGAELPERHVGEVWVSGPSLMRGYLGNRKATAEVLQRGWLRTGDLGYRVGDELFLVGRLKNMLIVRGHNYYAEDIEAAVEEVHGVRKGNAVAFGRYDESRGVDRLHLAVETRLRGEQELASLRENICRAVSESVGLTPDEVVLLAPGSLPKTTSGKKQRQKAAESLAEGSIRRPRKGEAMAMAEVVLRSQIAVLWHMLRRPIKRSLPRRNRRAA